MSTVELDRFDLILIDEAHLLPPDGEGMYRTFLADARVVSDVDEAVELAEAGALAPARTITVRSVVGEKYDRLVRYQLGDMSQPVIAGDPAGKEPEYIPITDDEVPF